MNKTPLVINASEAPLITSAGQITPENCPEMYAELCNGCGEGECADYE